MTELKKIVIIGATSGIGKYLAQHYAQTDARIAIMGRREEKLHEIAASGGEKFNVSPMNSSRTHVKFIAKVCDVTDTEVLPSVLDALCTELGGIDLIIVCAGVGDENPQLNYQLEKPALITNVLGWTCVVDWSVKLFEQQGFGHLVSISSVAGLRGSGSAPAYSATKAYQINYLEGMCQKTHKSKAIFITDIRPGFVDTEMAKGDGIFWMASTEKAGRQICRAVKRRKRVAYVTRRWWIIALILRHIPSFIYCRM